MHGAKIKIMSGATSAALIRLCFYGMLRNNFVFSLTLIHFMHGDEAEPYQIT